MTSGVTRDSEGTGADARPGDEDLASRLDRFRQAARRAGGSPARDEVERLLITARELNLATEAAEDELAALHAALEALDVAEDLARHGAPVVPPLVALPAGETCHFVTPVRFGRRRSDQFGHLELTSSWLKFLGALDMSIVWSEVADVQRDGHDVRVSLTDSRRQMRFACHSASEAVRGCAIAQHLLAAARARAAAPPPAHAGV